MTPLGHNWKRQYVGLETRVWILVQVKRFSLRVVSNNDFTLCDDETAEYHYYTYSLFFSDTLYMVIAKYAFYTFMKFRCSKNQGEIIRLVILFLQNYVHMVDLENWRFNYGFFTSLFQIWFNLNFFIVCKALYIRWKEEKTTLLWYLSVFHPLRKERKSSSLKKIKMVRRKRKINGKLLSIFNFS